MIKKITAVVFCMLVMGACQKNAPVTLQTQTPLKEVPDIVSPFAQQHIGAVLLAHTLDQYPIWYNETITPYVAKVGAHVSMYSMRKTVSYQFYILDSETLFSFGLPAGHIFISRGLLKAMENESELAGVLGSEIAHVEAQDLTRLLFSGSDAKLVHGFGQNPDIITKAWHVLFTNRFSDDTETKADQRGLLFAAHFGYDPHAFVNLMQRLQTLQENRNEKTEPGDLDLNFLYHRVSMGKIIAKDLEKKGFAVKKSKTSFKDVMKDL